MSFKDVIKYLAELGFSYIASEDIFYSVGGTGKRLSFSEAVALYENNQQVKHSKGAQKVHSRDKVVKFMEGLGYGSNYMDRTFYAYDNTGSAISYSEAVKWYEDSLTSDNDDEGNDPVRPNHYAQNKADVIEALYQVLPFDEFRGFMKGNIIKYTVRYNLKNGAEDLAKANEYIKRLDQYEELERDEKI